MACNALHGVPHSYKRPIYQETSYNISTYLLYMLEISRAFSTTKS